MEFPVFSKTIDLEEMRSYMPNRDNIHTDDAVAKRAGLGGAVTQGGHLVSFLNELLTRTFGRDFLDGGTLEVNFLKMVRPGDVVTPRAELVERTAQADGKALVRCRIWLENQRGETVTAGTAEVLTGRS